MKKIVNLLFVGFFLMLSTVTSAQENNDSVNERLVRKNNVDLTFGGTGLFVSVNYSRILLVKPNYFINASIGVGSVPVTGGIVIPHQATINLGKKSNFLELGIGGSYWFGENDNSVNNKKTYSYQLSPIVGWRKHFSNNLILRIYMNPLFYVSGEYYVEYYPVIPYAGISLGYSF